MAAAAGERTTQPITAARLLGAAASLREVTRGPALPVEQPLRERAMATAQASLGEAAYASAWAEGTAMTPEQAIAYALEDAAST